MSPHLTIYHSNIDAHIEIREHIRPTHYNCEEKTNRGICDEYP